jgi:CheY-like chemotaxis protein
MVTSQIGPIIRSVTGKILVVDDDPANVALLSSLS